MNRKISVSTAITIAIIAMTVTFSVTMIMAREIFDRTIPSIKEKESMYSKLSEIDKYVRANYYGEIQDPTLYDMIGYGYILGTGDKNAAYYSARQFSELLDIQSGNVMGIGVDVVKDSSGYARVTEVYDGSPAEDLGVQVNGFITSVEGTDTKTLSRENIIAKMRGEFGTEAHFGYMAPDGTTSDFSAIRRKYTIPSVEYAMIGENCGYIRIFRFDSTTQNQFSRAVNELQDAGAKAMVFDLRDNGGGLLSAATDCLDMLVPSGDLVLAEYKDGSRKVLGESDESSVDLPMVVMVNKGTGSSAELFAATLREYNGAQLMGEKTMGKGSIQAEPHRMSDGSAVVITVAKMLTAKENSFDGTGLEVDIKVAPKPGVEGVETDLATDSMIQQAVTLAKVAAGLPVDSNPLNTEETGSEAVDGETAEGEAGAEGDAPAEGTDGEPAPEG